ncbi:hypothetical protein IHE44_0013594 [Lamprotornis superbus]|uniref:Uncharacterized protein n=1 Tax=Lamprotornis superbus TaxID=245042 RepID=A0A835TVS2_9PASS|nr:hypothetical protein IHE44_0013594 [Lamprotornis superbus]
MGVHDCTHQFTGTSPTFEPPLRRTWLGATRPPWLVTGPCRTLSAGSSGTPASQGAPACDQGTPSGARSKPSQPSNNNFNRSHNEKKRAGPLVEHVCWDLETEAQHLLVGRHVPDQESGAASSQGGSQHSFRSLLNVPGWVAVFGEPVAVHSGKGSRAAGLPDQEMPEHIQKLHSQSWQIHHYVESGFLFFLQERELFAELLPHRPPQEVPAVHVEHLDLGVHFVELAVVQEPAVGLGVEVVGKHSALSLGCWDGERPDPSEDVEEDIAGLEQLHYAAVLCGQARVPVHFGEVQFIGNLVIPEIQMSNVANTAESRGDLLTFRKDGSQDLLRLEILIGQLQRQTKRSRFSALALAAPRQEPMV